MSIGVGDNGQSVLSNSSVVVVADQNRMTLWCDGNNGGWDVCKWYRPNFGNDSESDSCLYANDIGKCPHDPGVSQWDVSKRGTQCSLAVGPVESDDVGPWKCLLLPKNSGNGGK